MNKNTKLKIILGSTSAVMTVGLAAFGLSASAALDNGGFTIKSTYVSNPSIIGLAGMDPRETGPVDPEEGDPGGETPIPSAPTVYGTTIFYALDGDVIRNTKNEINNKGDVRSFSVDVPEILGESGEVLDSYLFSYDSKGRAIVSAQWYDGNWNDENGVIDEFWVDLGDSYKRLGQVARSTGEKSPFTESSPDGTLYVGATKDTEAKIYKSTDAGIELFRTIPRSSDESFAVSNSGVIAMRSAEGKTLLIDNDGAITEVAQESFGIAPLPGGGFALGTKSGIAFINESGGLVSTKELGAQASRLQLGANGRIAYFLGDLNSTDHSYKTEIRTFTESGEDQLWAYNKENYN